MKKISVIDLIIEVGRQCTMCCPHCLRGPQENVTCNLTYVKKLIDQCESVGSVTFSGGEPFLYPDEIIEIINYIMRKNVDVSGFYVATNGSIIDYSLMSKFCEFYQYCMDHGGEEFDADYTTCNIDISMDQFHDGLTPEAESFFKMFRFVHHRDEYSEPKDMLKEGNAYENGFGRFFDNSPQDFEVDVYGPDNDIQIERIYLNSLGYLYPVCDLSYKSQREWLDEDTNRGQLPNILSDFSLAEQINNWNLITLEEVA